MQMKDLYLCCLMSVITVGGDDAGLLCVVKICWFHRKLLIYCSVRVEATSAVCYFGQGADLALSVPVECLG
jgi:hypothetical protein